MPSETNNLPDINPDIPNNEAVSKEIPLPEEAVPAACEPDCESAPETAVPELSAYKEECGSDEDDDFAEDEIIDEDEFIEEDEPIDEDEFIEEDEPIDEDEFIEEDEPIDEDEFIEEDEPIDEDEFIDEDEPIDEDEFIEEDEPIDEDEFTEEDAEEPDPDEEDFASLFEDDAQDEPDTEDAPLTEEQIALKEALSEVSSMPAPAPKAPKASVVRRISEEEYAEMLAAEEAEGEKEEAEASEEIPEHTPEAEAAPEAEASKEKEKPAVLPKAKPEKNDGCLRDVFLLYCSADLSLASKTAALLENNGISCVFPDRDLPRSDPDHRKTVEKAIGVSRIVLVITGKNASKRRQIIEYLDKAVSAGKRVVQLKRDEEPLSETLTALLHETPTLRAKSFKPQRLVMLVNAVLSGSEKANSKKKRRKEEKKTHKKKVINLKKIHSSVRNALGKRLLALSAIVYLILTAVSYMTQFGYSEFLYGQFPSLVYVTDKIDIAYAYISSYLPFNTGLTALMAALLSVGFTLLMLPFTRYSIKRAGNLYIFLNTAVLIAAGLSQFLAKPDLVIVTVSNLPLLASFAILVPIKIVSAHLTRIRR